MKSGCNFLLCLLVAVTLVMCYIYSKQSSFTANQVYSKELEARKRQGLLNYDLRMPYCNGRPERPPLEDYLKYPFLAV